MGAIFDEYFDYVWHTLSRLGIHHEDLEDLAQDVFLKVYARLDDYDPARPMRAWLFGFAYRVAADYRRLARHRFEVSRAAPEPADPGHSVDERIDAEEHRRLLLTALASLDLAPRAIVTMHDVDDISMPDIAEALGIPLNTAYSRLRLAREQLAQAVRKLKGLR
jgi:RNA polymerase sigma-70 factor (ECF subfamily)